MQKYIIQYQHNQEKKIKKFKYSLVEKSARAREYERGICEEVVIKVY